MKKYTGLVAVISMFLSLSFVMASLVKADTLSWTTSPPTVVSAEDTSINWQNYCESNFKSPKMAVTVNINDLSAKTECFLGEHAGVKVFNYDSFRAIGVQFPGDKLVYPAAVNCFSCVYLESKDTFIAVESQNDIRSGRVVIYKNFLKRLSLVNSPVPSERYYSFDKSSPEFISNFYQEPGYQGFIKHIQRSDNDKWLIVEYVGKGFVRINLETMEMFKFSDWQTDYWYAGPSIEYDITDDGQHIAIFGNNTQSTIYDIIPGCGAHLTPYSTEEEVAQNQPVACPVTYMATPNGEASNNTYMPHLRAAFMPQFSDDGGEITFYATSYDSNQPRKITLRAHGYTSPAQLDYLALGDSYSSGEGDTELNPATGKKYYRYWTDNEENKAVNQPREKCHVSTRSYPYLLAQRMDLALDAPKQWDSVACSGAVTWDIKKQASENYQGQGGRLKDFDSNLLKEQGLSDFIPGRQKQVAFVKEHKPKAVTLTIGGNDIDFSGIVEECASSVLTCSQAEETTLRGQVGQAIKEKFKDIKETINDIQVASPNTKIFFLGYPQFIYDGTAVCGPNVGITDSAERLMMTEGVKYLNSVIEAAAKATGAVYVDIENSLVGGRMCELGHYVTGVWDVRFDSNQYSSTFHPNHSGHARMADAVEQQFGFDTLLTYPYAQQKDESVNVPEPTPYFANSMAAYNKSARHEKVVTAPLVKGRSVQVKGEKYQLEPNSTVVTTAYSDPVSLGSFTVNSDGSFDTTIAVPTSLPAGFHTLVFSGKTYSGEPTDIYQIVEVRGSDPNDIDEDGVVDSLDKCIYIPVSGMDVDSDNQDDACDPEIGPAKPKEPYRLRAGDPAKTYAGQPEIVNYLYLERNVNASVLTGITGDYDPDHDGWAVVGVNHNFSQPGPYANFWIDGVDGNKIPHVSFRTKENGCVQYKPTSLAKVMDASVRTLTQEAVDTNTCRTESPGADADHNGQPDNVQPLYRARNGDSAKGENPNKLYLERSTRAAEAQLGKSDYATNASSPTDPMDTIDRRQEWSLLATSNNLPFISAGTYKTLATFNSQLYVLSVTGFNPFYMQCTAYKPDSLATIKQTSQMTRLLQMDFMQTLLMQLQGRCG